MRANIEPPDRPDAPHRLFLLPETKADLLILEQLSREYELTNLGRNAETGDVLHVGVELRRQGNEPENGGTTDPAAVNRT